MMKPRLTVLTATLLALAGTPLTAIAGDSRTDAALKHLDPETRLTEACNLAAMDRLDRDPNQFHPDRVAVDQFSSPERNGDTLQGSGGVFRSGGAWYHLNFKCAASHDHMKILSFSYTVGKKVPKADWDTLHLYP
jgi:hypothetical protein